MKYGRLLAIVQFFVDVGFQPQQYFMCSCANMIHKIIKLYRDLWRATSHIQHLLRGLPASTVLHVCPFMHYTFVRKKDPHRNNVIVWFREGYQPYSSFVEEGFQPQQSYMFAHLYIIHSCAKRIRMAIMFLYDWGRSTSHIQHLLKRASCFNAH